MGVNSIVKMHGNHGRQPSAMPDIGSPKSASQLRVLDGRNLTMERRLIADELFKSDPV